MDRRANAGEMIHWILRLFFTLGLLILLVAQISMIVGVAAAPRHMELSLYQARLVHGPSGLFATEEGTGRVLPGIIDLNKYLDERYLDKSYQQDEEVRRYAARIRLYDDADKIGSDETFGKRVLYNQRDLYEVYGPLGEAGLSGKGGALYERRVLPVQYAKKSGTLVPAWLLVETIRVT